MMEYLRICHLLKWPRYYRYMVSEDYHICFGRGMVASSRISVDILQLGNWVPDLHSTGDQFAYVELFVTLAICVSGVEFVTF